MLPKKSACHFSTLVAHLPIDPARYLHMNLIRFQLSLHVQDPAAQSLTQPVVWLAWATSAEWKPERSDNAFEVRLPARFSVKTEKLQHYLSWLRPNQHSEMASTLLTVPEMNTPCVADFFVYFGTIATDKIELKLTPENLLPVSRPVWRTPFRRATPSALPS